MSDDVNKLMDIAKNPIKEDQYKKLPPVRRFMVSDGVDSGNYPIPSLLVYDRYVTWCNAYKVDQLTFIKFFKDLALYCPKKITKDGSFYLLSPKGFDLSPQYLQIVKDKKWKSRGTKEKKTKEKRKNSKS